jgi:hypothetical protein
VGNYSCVGTTRAADFSAVAWLKLNVTNYGAGRHIAQSEYVTNINCRLVTHLYGLTFKDTFRQNCVEALAVFESN